MFAFKTIKLSLKSKIFPNISSTTCFGFVKQTYINIFSSLDTVNQVAILLSIITITLLLFNNEILKPRIAKRTKLPIPIELIVVVGGVLLSRFLKMEETWNIIPVGHIPVGLPPPTLPNLSLWKELLVDAIAIAIVSYSVTVSMALIFGQKLKYEIDFNQELLAMVSWHFNDFDFFTWFSMSRVRAIFSDLFLHACRSQPHYHGHWFSKPLAVWHS